MKKSARIMLGSLGVAHFVVAIALLPVVLLALSYGFFLNLVILPGLTWLGVLGWRLFRPNESLRRTMRITHLVLAPCAVFLVSRGFLFLNAAERSAPAGGGYVTLFGVIALVMGLLAGGLSIASLCISFSSAFKAATAAGMPAPAGGGRNDSVLPELSVRIEGSLSREEPSVGRSDAWPWSTTRWGWCFFSLPHGGYSPRSACCRTCRTAPSGRTCLWPSQWLQCREGRWQGLAYG